jgi:hypothetical protein
MRSMARLVIGADTLTVRLSWPEKLAVRHRNLTFPLSAVEAVQVDPKPRVTRPRQGLRVPGWRTLAFVRTREGREFWDLRGRRPAVVVTMAGVRLRRLAVSSRDAERMVSNIEAARSGRR